MDGPTTIPLPPTAEPADDVTPRARRLLRPAWWSFALLPFSFVGATLLGNSILTAMGHDVDSETNPTWEQAIVAGIPAVIVMVIPALMAIWFGRRAIGAGHPKGHEPSIAGLVVGAALVAMNVLALLVRLADEIIN